VRLELLPRAGLDEQRLEHVLDPFRRPDPPPDAGAAAAGDDLDEIAGVDVVQPLRVEDDGNAGSEVRLAGEELAPPPDLDDQRGA
jgi:hypothetical protein